MTTLKIGDRVYVKAYRENCLGTITHIVTPYHSRVLFDGERTNFIWQNRDIKLAENKVSGKSHRLTKIFV